MAGSEKFVPYLESNFSTISRITGSLKFLVSSESLKSLDSSESLKSLESSESLESLEWLESLNFKTCAI